MQRDKGARAEREWAAVCRDNGFAEAHRGRQYHGGPETPDVCGTGPMFYEVKRTERLRLQDAVSQVLRDCPQGKLPAVAHRQNHGPWLVILPAAVFFEILRRSDLCGPEAAPAGGEENNLT